LAAQFGFQCTGTGSEVMQRIAAPMIGGMVSPTVLTLVVIPAVYSLVKGWRLSQAWGVLDDAATTTVP
jgi:Cu/Ag efflux pump CusA